MTLRQLIEHVIDRNMFNSCATYIQHINPEWKDREFTDIVRTYKNVAVELADLPGDDEIADHQIIIQDVVSELQNVKENYVDVHLHDGESSWSIDFIDWNQLVDLKIVDHTSSRDLCERLANILYEVTFWGMTRESVCQEQHRLTKTCEHDNLIEVSYEQFIAEINELS